MENRGGPAPIQITPQEGNSGGPVDLNRSKKDTVPQQMIYIAVVDEYRKYASDLLSANPISGFSAELKLIKERPLPQVNQGKNVELLKLNGYIRDVNNAAEINDTELFEKAVKHLIIFLG